MRHRPSALPFLLAFVLLSPRPAASDELDKDDRKWLEQVRPILVRDEEKIVRNLKEKDDRLEFRRIFWARRDPDLRTPENEFRTDYEAARAEADLLYRTSGRAGSATDCGRVFLLLGKPNDVQQQGGTVSPGLRPPEVWTYRDKPGRTFEGGEARIAFDSDCRCVVNIAEQLDRIAASKVVQPSLEYRFGENGRLVKLEDLLPKDSPARALVKSPRQDFPLEFDVSYLRASDGTTGLVGLLRGEVADLPVDEREGRKVADVVVVTSAVAEAGEELSWVEKALAADVKPDGSFVASFGLGLPPGTYTLKVGALIEKSGAGSLTSQTVEVPDFSKEEVAEDGSTVKVPTVASILFVREIEDLPPGVEPDSTNAYAAFQLGQTRLIPYFGRELQTTDAVSFFYLVYDLPVDPVTGKGDAVAVLSLLRDGKTVVAKAPEMPIDTATNASAVGPVPLGGFGPGSYVAQLRVTDRISKRTVVRNERFKIAP